MYEGTNSPATYATENAHNGLMTAPAYVFVVACALLVLPFTKALTLDVGFPLKIYEVLFAIAFVFFLFAAEGLQRRTVSGYLIFIFLFWMVASASSLHAILTDADQTDVSYRGGAASDSTMRTVYLVFNISVLLMVFCASRKYTNIVVDSWLWGAILAVSYHLYCFFSFLVIGDAFLLPGLQEHQVGQLGSLSVPRSGTFEEGNFAGLFYLLSMSLAIYRKKYLYLVAALIGVVLSLSTSSFAGLLVFFIGYVVSRRMSRFKKTLYISGTIASAFGAFYLFGVDTKFTGEAGASGAVRLNEAMTGLQIFYAHPLFGAGLGQYGFLFNRFEWDPAFSVFFVGEKHIPNNIYVELLSETGVIGFLLFMIFSLRWTFSFARTVYPLNIFFLSGLAILVAYMGYPTFNITYLWCFVGIALAIRHSTQTRSTH